MLQPFQKVYPERKGWKGLNLVLSPSPKPVYFQNSSQPILVINIIFSDIEFFWLQAYLSKPLTTRKATFWFVLWAIEDLTWKLRLPLAKTVFARAHYIPEVRETIWISRQSRKLAGEASANFSCRTEICLSVLIVYSEEKDFYSCYDRFRKRESPRRSFRSSFEEFS